MHFLHILFACGPLGTWRAYQRASLLMALRPALTHATALRFALIDLGYRSVSS